MSYETYAYDLQNAMTTLKVDYPAHLLSIWGSMIDSCDGYIYTIFEYDNEMGVRDSIALLLKDATLLRHEEFRYFIEEVSRIDEAIKALDLPDNGTPITNNWWSRLLPKRATADFIMYVERLYGKEIAAQIQVIDF